MAKRNGKTGAKQKNKQGFDSAKTDTEFSKEIGSGNGSGSAEANKAHKDNVKKKKSSKNQGEWNGMQ